ncbi:transporter substrate-binding domain-containing protein [Paenibacillus sp. NEAU-GSW1]|uniref:transporter substrate-binding domain-containing protein n=1 Tax=Paenibacillus sp. NEAU-GSW1 TaxID=2682486 RepID=UPI0012E32511|nr:transporter substrate-binding domain-containing protein [Paenibacillus sp. NEAU-GSW1]MUT67204.1 transporter substrate-binding domain-containing protein [Paenibacillus sp. NEAU-GSW1]
MKKFTIAAALLALTLVVSACGANSSSGSNSQTASGNKEASQKVTKIIVGTGTQFPNVCFIDENGKLTGFDVELVKELDNRLPEYEFEFQTLDFSNLLLSLETKKIDFVAHQMEKNPEREEKFLFNKEPYSIFLTKVAVDKNDTAIHSIDDLKGKKVFTSPTSNQAYFLEQYNKQNDNALNIVYSSGAANDLVNLIQTKRVDASLSTDFALAFYPGADGKPALKTVGEPLIQSDVLFVLRKDSQELADKLDEAIKSVKEDGTLAKLSVQWLGEDFTKTLDEAKAK